MRIAIFHNLPIGGGVLITVYGQAKKRIKYGKEKV